MVQALHFTATSWHSSDRSESAQAETPEKRVSRFLEPFGTRVPYKPLLAALMEH